MKPSLNIVAITLIVLGAIWILQGVNILPASFMTGQMQWAVYGGITAGCGIAALFIINRRRDKQ